MTENENVTVDAQRTRGVTKSEKAGDGVDLAKLSKSDAGTKTVCTVSFRRKKGAVTLSVKGSAEWENWLKATKRTVTREGFFKNPGERRFYVDALPNPGVSIPPGADRVEGELFIFDSERGIWLMNLGVFRIEGISRGLEFICVDLMAADAVEDALRNTTTVIRKIYDAYIRPVSVSVEVKVRGLL